MLLQKSLFVYKPWLICCDLYLPSLIRRRGTIALDYSTIWVQIPSTQSVRVGRSVTSNLKGNNTFNVPLVTVFDYFVWRIWFAPEIINSGKEL